MKITDTTPRREPLALRRPRIITEEQRLAHIADCCKPDQGEEHHALMGDSATVHSNYMHNPATGFHEFARDTPTWVVEIAKRRKWVATVGNIQWA